MKLEVVKLGASVPADLRDAFGNASDEDKSTLVQDEKGKFLAAIVPISDVHEPGRCCCSDCPERGARP